MKLETFVLCVVIAFALLWLATLVTGLISLVPWGWLGLIPVALVLGIFGAVLWQRLASKEDDYYGRNVDK